MRRHQKLFIFGMIALILVLAISMSFSQVALAEYGGGSGSDGQSGSTGNPGEWGGLRPGGQETGQPWSGSPGGPP
jgi:hypothetical protein